MFRRSVAQASSPARPGTISTVVLAGIVGGAIDFVYACGVGMVHGRSVVRVWQGVAAGWLGKAAIEGGLAAMALGVVTHFGIAICMAAAYAVAATRVTLLYRRPARCGVAYGLLLYAIMYGVVLPIRYPTAFPRWDGIQSVTDLASHIGVGLGIAIVLSRRAVPPRPVT